jgi:pilus assembly protein CpaF
MIPVRGWDRERHHGLLSALRPLLGLLWDGDVTDIAANGFDEVWAKKIGRSGYGRMEGVAWASEEDFRIACVGVSEVIGRALSEQRPLFDGRLPGGERVNIAIPPACARISMTVRKFPQKAISMEDLIERGSVDERILSISRTLMRGGASILVSGGCGAGKTTLLNALSREMPEQTRVVSIEDARELQIQQPNWTALETVEPIVRGATPVTIGDLVRNALRQDPGRIIVGEVRGEEAFFLLRALSTGHAGLGTVHAASAEDALHQVVLLALLAKLEGLSAHLVASIAARAIDAVFHQEICEDGRRRVVEIVLLDRPGVVTTGAGEPVYRTKCVARWEQERQDWVFPEECPAHLLRRFSRVGLRWPKMGGEA